MKSIWDHITGSLIGAGIIMLLIGFWYLIVKAGIPYQDPPLELQIKYAVNMGVGDTLTISGACVFAAGLAGRIIPRLAGKIKK